MDFTCKVRWVNYGHCTPDPTTSSYMGVLSRESIRIVVTHAALVSLGVMPCDIMNAYLQAPTLEKHYVICGTYFGLENVKKVALIKIALCCGKVAGQDLWHHLRTFMEFLRVYVKSVRY